MTGYDREYRKDENGLYNHLTVHFHLDKGVKTKEEINHMLANLLDNQIIDAMMGMFEE